MIVSGTTKSGFQFDINNEACTDVRFLRAMTAVMRYNKAAEEAKDLIKLMDTVDSLLELLLPKDTERLYQHIQSSNNGFVPITALMLELDEIIEAATPKK